MKRRVVILFLALCSLATPLAAQNANQQCTNEKDQQTTSGASGTLTFQDQCGTRANSWEMKVSGAPTGVTVTINGCMRGGTCSALTTSTSTTNVVLGTVGGPFDNYQIAFTLTGGSSPALTFNRTGSPGAVSNSSATAWFYASAYATSTSYGGDYCLLLNNIVTAVGAGPTPGALIVWDIPGKLKCASPPIPVGTLFSGNIWVTAAVAFWDSSTTGGWFIPQGVIVQGTGLGAQTGSGAVGFDIVACPGVIANLCPNAWPRDSVLTALLTDNPNYNYGGADRDSGFYYATIDCAYVQGCIAFQNHFGQENAGLYFAFVFGASNNGIGIDLGEDYTGGNSQNSAIHNIEYADNNGPAGATINANTCAPGGLALRNSLATSTTLNGNASQQAVRLVTDSTFSHFNCGQSFTAPNSLIMYSEGGNSTFLANHYEYFASNAIVVGELEFMGSLNTDAGGTNLTYQANGRGISMNPIGFTGGVAGGWPLSYTGTIFIFNGTTWTGYTISSGCASVTACTITTSAGANLTNAPYFLYASTLNKQWTFTATAAAAGAEGLVFDGVDSCCSSGANSVVQIINTGTATPTTKNIAIRNYRSHLPNVATNLIADGFNTNVTTPGGGGGYGEYLLDSSQRVAFDDSGFNISKFRGPIGAVQGAKPTAAGCGTDTVAGGNSYFTVTIGTGGAGCTLTVTWTQSAGVLYMCQAADLTTVTVIPTYSTGTLTTCVINLPATVVTNDKIQVLAGAY